jgi:DNA polymerase III delta subunit
VRRNDINPIAKGATSVQVERACKKSLILLIGDEDALRRRAMLEILDTVGIGQDDFDLESVDAQTMPPADWFAAAGTTPFLAQRRTVIVRHLLQADIDKAKAVPFTKLPPTALLILVADEETGSDDKMLRLKTARDQWKKLVSEAQGAVLEFNPDAKAAKAAVKQESNLLGLTLSERGADLLVDMTAGSLSRALEELEKLALYTGSNGVITEREVRVVVVPSREWNVFKMADSILSNQIGEALRQLRILIGASSKAEDAAFRQIIPQLSKSLRLVWQGRVCFEAGCGPSNAPESVLQMFPGRNNLAKEQPYRQNAVMALARKTTLDQIARALQVLSDTDSRLKGVLPGFTAVDTLERMILEMAEAVSFPA